MTLIMTFDIADDLGFISEMDFAGQNHMENGYYITF